MVQYQRYNQLKKGGDEEAGTLVFLWTNPCYYRRRRPKLLSVLLLSLLSCSFILAPHFFTTSSALSHLYSFGVQNEGLVGDMDLNVTLCSSISNGTICCDRSHFRSDICLMVALEHTLPPLQYYFIHQKAAMASLIMFQVWFVES